MWGGVDSEKGVGHAVVDPNIKVMRACAWVALEGLEV